MSPSSSFASDDKKLSNDEIDSHIERNCVDLELIHNYNFETREQNTFAPRDLNLMHETSAIDFEEKYEDIKTLQDSAREMSDFPETYEDIKILQDFAREMSDFPDTYEDIKILQDFAHKRHLFEYPLE